MTKKREADRPVEDVTCVHCGRQGQPGKLVPIAIGVWLHDACWAAWFAALKD